MKLMTVLMTLILTSNLAFAGDSNARAFAKGKKHLVLGSFKGKMPFDNKDCTATVTYSKDVNGADLVIGRIDFFDRKGKPQSEVVELNSKTDDVEIAIEDYDGDKEVRIQKSKTVPEPDNEGAELTIIESIKQYSENGKLSSLVLEWFEVNEHSDPSESSLHCDL